MTALHLSLNAPDLAAAVERYRTMFGVEPAKLEPDYAKFEIDGLVLSLVPQSFSGVPLRFGVGDTAPRPVVPNGVTVEAPKTVEWEHFIASPWPSDLPMILDAIRLIGTFNGGSGNEDRVLPEVFRALKPGGTLMIHGLMGDRALPSMPGLPGPAAVVRSVPVPADLLQSLTNAGFADVRIAAYPPPWMVWEGVPLREVKLAARKPLEPQGECVAVYRGPFAWVTLDGLAFRRCEPVRIDGPMRSRLPAESFDFAELP